MRQARPLHRRLAVVAIVVVVALSLLPMLLPDSAAPAFVLGIVTQALIWALLAASWDLLSGYTGQISFGHSGFFAVGAYAAAILSKELGLSAWLGLGGALLISGMIGI